MWNHIKAFSAMIWIPKTTKNFLSWSEKFVCFFFDFQLNDIELDGTECDATQFSLTSFRRSFYVISDLITSHYFSFFNLIQSLFTKRRQLGK